MQSTLFRKTFRQLVAWREAHLLTLEIYSLTKSFPQEERFGITNQLRRASSSVAAQIAEGAQMPTFPHRLLFYQRAYASAAEVDYFLELSKDLGYMAMEQYNKLLNHVNRVCFLTHKLSRSSPSSLSKPSAPTSISRNHERAAAHSPDESIRERRRR